MSSSKYKPEPKDAKRNERVAPTPQHRTASALVAHKQTIDDLSGSLPIVERDEAYSTNFQPPRIAGTREHFTDPTGPLHTGADFPYAPPQFQVDTQTLKLNRILELIEQQQIGVETPSSQDLLLYVCTGVFFLFTFDTFVNLGRRLR
jgi:hypothetical protein